MGPKWEALTVMPQLLFIGQPELIIWRYVDTKLKADRSLLSLQGSCYTPNSTRGAETYWTSCKRLPAPGRTPCSPENLQQSRPTWEKISDGLSESCCPGEEPLEFPKALIPAQDPRGC